jgi:uncharacterized membrane protein YdjX (TVP38/TMEM64 family)
MTSNALRGLLLFSLILAILLFSQGRNWQDIETFKALIKDAGVIAPLLFIALYTLATIAFFPGSVLTLAGGILFGPLLGILYNLCGAILGSFIAFLIARYLAADWVESKARGRLRRVKQGIENEGWRFVAFVRLVPIFPFNLMNYLLGLTRIPLSHYLITTAIAMLPGAVAYTYLGYAGREIAAGEDQVIQKALIGLALLACVVFLPKIFARIRLQ